MGEAVDYYYWYNFCTDLPAPPQTNPAVWLLSLIRLDPLASSHLCFLLCSSLTGCGRWGVGDVLQGLCKNTTGTGNFYQVSNRTSTGVDTDCHILSYSSNVTWELIDAANPAMGIVQHYGGGDVRPHPPTACLAHTDLMFVDFRFVLVGCRCARVRARARFGSLFSASARDRYLRLSSSPLLLLSGRACVR